MKQSALVVIALLLFAQSAFGADDAVTRATKLYEKRHYEEAISMLNADIPALDQSRKGAAHLALGMLYLKSAELYRAFYEESLAIEQIYLKKISSVKGKERSLYAEYYMGLTLLEGGKPGLAATAIENFLTDNNLDSLAVEIAKINLGLCFYLNGEKERAENLWGSIVSTAPEIKSELASAYSRAGLKEKDPVALCDQSAAEAKRAGKVLTNRMVRNAISVYTRARLVDKGFDVLKRSNIKAYSYREVLGKSKIIYFYDPSLLGDISDLYSQLCIISLEKIAVDPRLKDAGQYYLSEAYFLFGNTAQSAKVMTSVVSDPHMPQQYKNRVRIWQVANDYRLGKKTEAIGMLTEQSKKQPIDPDLLSEILFTCARIKAECGMISGEAEPVAESGQGKRFVTLNFALGKYYLVRKNSARAITYMEAGRDKSNKNKIEFNDPLMLVDLAGLYVRSKKFSEALEIYFEMSKQFPAVRQIQEAMQGIYAMEQKSAGDVKIF